MVRKTRSSAKLVEARYAELVKTQDAFWRETFPQFIESLKVCFQEPNAAGMRLISRYLEAPRLLARELGSTPEAFGPLLPGTNLKQIKLFARSIMAGGSQAPLVRCAETFAVVRAAGAELDKMRLSHPRLFHDLQRRRAMQNQNPSLPATQAPAPAPSIKHYAGLSRYFGVRSSVKNPTSGTA